MAFNAANLKNNEVGEIAIRVAGSIRNFQARLQRALVAIDNDNYTAILADINSIRVFDSNVQAIIAAGKAQDVVQRIITLFGENVTAQDLNQFRIDLVAIRNYIRSNIGLFIASYDSNDNIVFSTSPGLSVKSGLVARINAALAHISGS